MSDALLEVRGLQVVFGRRGRGKPGVAAVDGVSFDIAPGEIVGLVGESGSGKSTIGRSILGLQAAAAGTVELGGSAVISNGKYARANPRRLQAVFQDPYGSLNPARTVGSAVVEPLEFDTKLGAKESAQTQQRLLSSVGLPEDAAGRYPHRFSGGQRQRICIARAVSTTPELVICDEAVSALDLVTRASIINTLTDLQRDGSMAVLFISHDLTITAHISNRVIVLYRGRVMEQGPAEVISTNPRHPYTKALLAAVPVAEPAKQRQRREERRAAVRTTTANAAAADPRGCPFAPRCPMADAVCHTVRPKDTVVDASTVACHLFDPSSGHPGAVGVNETVHP